MITADQFAQALNSGTGGWTSGGYFGGGQPRYMGNIPVARAQAVTPGTTTVNPDLNIQAINNIPKTQGAAGSMPKGSSPISQSTGQGWGQLISALGGVAQGFLQGQNQPQVQQQTMAPAYTPALANFQMSPLGQGQQQIYG